MTLITPSTRSNLGDTEVLLVASTSIVQRFPDMGDSQNLGYLCLGGGLITRTTEFGDLYWGPLFGKLPHLQCPLKLQILPLDPFFPKLTWKPIEPQIHRWQGGAPYSELQILEDQFKGYWGTVSLKGPTETRRIS